MSETKHNSSERTKDRLKPADRICMDLKLGQTLSAILKERRLGLKEVSRETKIPVSTLAEWTSNRPARDPVKLKRLCDYLGVSLHYLLFGCEDNQNPIEKIIREDLFQGAFEVSIKRIKLPRGVK
jgi:transcriptional regulator with XRE-family HTH domain